MTAPAFGPDDGMDTDALHSDSAMSDDTDDVFGGITFEQSNEALSDDEAPIVDYDSFLNADQPEPEPFIAERETLRIAEPTRRPRNARAYERKVQGLFAVGVKLTISSEHTTADAASMLLHGPAISEAAGNYAAVNPKAAAIIDAITDQTENPATALLMATVPFALQVIRNHEPQLERRQRGIPIWRGKRIRFRFGFSLGNRMKRFTRDPRELTVEVLTNPEIRKALLKQGINIVSE